MHGHGTVVFDQITDVPLAQEPITERLVGGKVWMEDLNGYAFTLAMCGSVHTRRAADTEQFVEFPTTGDAASYPATREPL